MEEQVRAECRSVAEFIEKLPPLHFKWEQKIFYRGQSDISYILKPSVLRDTVDVKRSERENEIYLSVMSECSNDFETEMPHIAILSKMQHYGVPTRLLDITTNALVALYFACESLRKMSADGVVYYFLPHEEDVRNFDSDAVAILASIPRFQKKEKEYLKKKAMEYRKLIANEKDNLKKQEIVRDFNSLDIVRRLLHEVKSEKIAFENIIRPSDLLSNYFIIPKKDNPRIIRQSGAFIIFGLNDDMEHRQVPMGKICIPSSSKKEILEELRYLGISKATLHPELYKMAEYINDNLATNSKF